MCRLALFTGYVHYIPSYIKTICPLFFRKNLISDINLLYTGDSALYVYIYFFTGDGTIPVELFFDAVYHSCAETV